MADRMPKIDEVAETSLAFVNGDDVGFDRNGSYDNREQEILCGRACIFSAARIIDGGSLDCCEYFRRTSFEGTEFCFIPDGCSLNEDERITDTTLVCLTDLDYLSHTIRKLSRWECLEE